MFLLRESVKIWKMFETRGPNRSPFGLRLDHILDHARSIWTLFGPRVVHLDRAWSILDRSWSKWTVRCINVVQTGVQTDFVRTTFWTTSCVAVPENHRLSLVLVNPRTQKVTHMQRSHTYALKVFQTIVAL